MKFANNEVNQFVKNGSYYAFFIACIQTFVAIWAQFINITLLFMDHSILYSIVFFVAVKSVAELGKIYFMGLKPQLRITDVLEEVKIK